MTWRALTLHAFTAGFALSALGTLALGAQESAGRCETAASILAEGQPRQADRWAYNEVRRCGVSGAKGLAAGIARQASTSDVATLEDFMRHVDSWRDASILSAVTRIAKDDAASPQARVFAIRHMILLLEPHLLFSYAGLTRGADTTFHPNGLVEWRSGCPVQMISAPHGSLVGEPLPTDYELGIRTTLASLAGSPGTPTPVRNAARCLQKR